MQKVGNVRLCPVREKKCNLSLFKEVLTFGTLMAVLRICVVLQISVIHHF